MKAAVYYETGGPEVFRYEDVPDPEPAPDGVLVELIGALALAVAIIVGLVVGTVVTGDRLVTIALHPARDGRASAVPAGAIADAAVVLDGAFVFVLSPALLEELKRSLGYPKIKRYLRNLGKAGVGYTTYAHMPNGIWSTEPELTRGGAVARRVCRTVSAPRSRAPHGRFDLVTTPLDSPG